MNTSGVSPLIGFVLLMAIVMGLIGILQSTALPQWNRAVEIKHFDSLKYEVAGIGEILSISASTRNPSKLVLSAGVSYPNYYFLISPSKASTTFLTRDLNISIEGKVKIGGEIWDLFYKNVTSAIMVGPNYLYSARSKFLYEHSAIFILENGLILRGGDQISFSNDSISLYILKANFKSFATTENVNLIFIPVLVSGKNLFTGKITLECYDEQTAGWWSRELSEIYGDRVAKIGNTVELNVDNITLTLTTFEIYISPGEILKGQQNIKMKVVNITRLDYQTVLINSQLQLGVKILDEFNSSVMGIPILVSDSSSGKSYNLFSDEFGEVWYTFHASRKGVWEVVFSIQNSTRTRCLEDCSKTFSITVTEFPMGGGTFTLTWFNESGTTTYEIWHCESQICVREFHLNAKYQGSNVQGALVNFATNNEIVRIISGNTTYTNSNGNASVRLEAKNTTLGLVNLIGIVGDSVAILPINVVG
ncbi:MAG: hypothetical protein N3D09_03690 [Archaeoglobaceae archaeon]|nr:hypothetical protein [Archaeoglobaceae archaeon]